MKTKRISRIFLFCFLLSVWLIASGSPVQAKSKITLTVKKKTVYLEIGKSVSLGAKANRNAKVTYKSSKSSVVKVNSKGKIKALKQGKAVITVQAKKKGYQTASLKVTVYALYPQEITGASGSVFNVEMEKGAVYTSPLSARTALSYKSSDPSVVKVLSGGKLQALKAGYAEITVTAKQSKVYAKAETTIYVTVGKKGSVKDGIHYESGWGGSLAYGYKGALYCCGELPLSVERELAAKYVPFMKDYLKTYIPKEEAFYSDHTLAVLAAIRDTFIRYELHYDSTPASLWSTYDTSNVRRDEWYSIATTGKGLCEDFTSLFSYMCYLEEVECWTVGGGGHSENMLIYQGHAYIIEPQDFSFTYENVKREFYRPVIGKPTSPNNASTYTSPFQKKIEMVGITTEAAFQALFPQPAVTGKTPLIAMVEHGEVYGAPAGTHLLTLDYQFYLDCEAADAAGDFYGNIWYNYDKRAWDMFD